MRAGGQPGETGDSVKVPVKGIDGRRTLPPSNGGHQGVGEVEIFPMVQGKASISRSRLSTVSPVISLLEALSAFPVDLPADRFQAGIGPGGRQGAV